MELETQGQTLEIKRQGRHGTRETEKILELDRQGPIFELERHGKTRN